MGFMETELNEQPCFIYRTGDSACMHRRLEAVMGQTRRPR